MHTVNVKFEHQWSFPITYEDALKVDGIYDSDGREPGGCQYYVVSNGKIVLQADYVNKRITLLPPSPNNSDYFSSGGLRPMTDRKMIITIESPTPEVRSEK